MGVLDEFEGLITSQWDSMKTLISMIKFEMKLARLSIVPLIFSICMMLVVLMTLWGTVMSMVGYGIWLTYHSIMAALSGVVLVNLLLFGLLKWYLSFNIHNMCFEHSRHYLKSRSTTSNDYANEQTQASAEKNLDTGKAITESTTPD